MSQAQANDDFKIGDRVQAADGPLMTVTWVFSMFTDTRCDKNGKVENQYLINCLWFDKQHVLQTNIFDIRTIVKR